ncbi:MAG: thiol peroxidase [Campylobacteraceae bacterium]|nr:thiol peroxidase [Campylobacteraceae bacterium]
MITTKLKGQLVNISGNLLNVGDLAPCITLCSQDLKDIDVGGKKDFIQIIATVPSLDTDVCAEETRKFNEKASSLKGVEISVVSQDLPFAVGRFCTTEGIENIKIASDFRDKSFSKAYGVLIDDSVLEGLCARAIFVIDTKGVIVYKELCDDITHEPNYKRIYEAVKNA